MGEEREKLIHHVLVVKGATMRTFLGSLPEFKRHSERLSHCEGYSLGLLVGSRETDTGQIQRKNEMKMNNQPSQPREGNAPGS